MPVRVQPTQGDSKPDFEQSIVFNLDNRNISDFDFDNFNAEPTQSRKELDAIDQCLTKHFHFLDNINVRKQRLKNILDLYNPTKNLNSTLNAIDQMNNIGVTHDVLKALFTDECHYIPHLSMKNSL